MACDSGNSRSKMAEHVPRLFEPPSASCFLSGARGTGKTTYLHGRYPAALFAISWPTTPNPRRRVSIEAPAGWSDQESGGCRSRNSFWNSRYRREMHLPPRQDPVHLPQHPAVSHVARKHDHRRGAADRKRKRRPSPASLRTATAKRSRSVCSRASTAQ